MTTITIPRTDQVRQALQRRYPSGLLPYGSDSDIAREFDVSRELVRQVKSSLGYKTDRRKMQLPRYQCPCGEIRTSKTLCARCRLITLPCHACGKPVSRSVRDTLRTLTHPRSRGNVYCDRSCLGKMAGKEFGFASAHGRAVLREQARQRSARTHCRKGHEFTKENTYLPKGGNRRCKTCERNRQKRYDLKRGYTAGSSNQGSAVPAGPGDHPVQP